MQKFFEQNLRAPVPMTFEEKRGIRFPVKTDFTGYDH
jgi:hypothetical protein